MQAQIWGRQVYLQGIGPRPLARKHLTADMLARTIVNTVENQDMRKHAAVLGERIRQEHGVGRAVQLITEQ